MKLLRRNLTTIHYLPWAGESILADSNDYETGEKKIVYGDAVELLCSVSSATGQAQSEMFGILESYDKVVITDDVSCPITEKTVLFVDKDPEYDSDGQPLYDYIVKRVAKSRNYISYAISKVDVS